MAPNTLPTASDPRNEGNQGQPQNPERRKFLEAMLGATVAAPLAALFEQVVAAEEKEKGHHLTKEELTALIDKEWNAQNAIFEEIASYGEHGMQKYYDKRNDKEQAFFNEKNKAGKGRCACCSDERITKYTNGSEGKIVLLRSPGSGILDALDRDDKDAFAPDVIKGVAETAVDAGVTVFAYHEGCGAAKAVFDARIVWLEAQGKKKEAEDLKEKGSEGYAKEWTAAVVNHMRTYAAELKLPHANSIKGDFISKEKMDGHIEVHRARIIYVTDEDEFDASYRGLPQGFVERTGGSNAGLNKVLRHVDILRRIGFNAEHGFGKKFSENPSEQFIICGIAESQERLDAIIAHARKQVSTLPDDVQKKIRVDGFLRPRK